jgi:hypothetical protein
MNLQEKSDRYDRWIEVTSDLPLDEVMEKAWNYDGTPRARGAMDVRFVCNLPSNQMVRGRKNDFFWCVLYMCQNYYNFTFTYRGLVFQRYMDNGGSQPRFSLTVNDPEGGLFFVFTEMIRVLDARIPSLRIFMGMDGASAKINYEGPVTVMCSTFSLRESSAIYVHLMDETFPFVSLIDRYPNQLFDVHGYPVLLTQPNVKSQGYTGVGFFHRGTWLVTFTRIVLSKLTQVLGMIRSIPGPCHVRLPDDPSEHLPREFWDTVMNLPQATYTGFAIPPFVAEYGKPIQLRQGLVDIDSEYPRFDGVDGELDGVLNLSSTTPQYLRALRRVVPQPSVRIREYFSDRVPDLIRAYPEALFDVRLGRRDYSFNAEATAPSEFKPVYRELQQQRRALVAPLVIMNDLPANSRITNRIRQYLG